MKQQILKFLRDEEGLTMVEYAVAGGMVAAAGVTAFQLLGVEVDGIITFIQTELSNVPGGTAG